MWVVPTIPKGVWELQRLQQLQLIHFFWIFLTLFLPSCFFFFFFFWFLTPYSFCLDSSSYNSFPALRAFLLFPISSLCMQSDIAFAIPIPSRCLAVYLCNEFWDFQFTIQQSFPKFWLSLWSQLQAHSMVGCTGDISRSDQGKCRLWLMINRWRQESTLASGAELGNIFTFLLKCFQLSFLCINIF